MRSRLAGASERRSRETHERPRNFKCWSWTIFYRLVPQACLVIRHLTMPCPRGVTSQCLAGSPTLGKAPEAVYMKSQEGSNEQRAQSQTHTMVMQHAEALACPVSNKPMPKGAWTKEEDETVMRLVGFYGPTRCPPLILMPPRASDCIHQCRLEHY